MAKDIMRVDPLFITLVDNVIDEFKREHGIKISKPKATRIVANRLQKKRTFVL